MAGYSGFSMSNNAVAAYDDGLCPASKISGVPAELVNRFCHYKEWHHSSKAYNRVKFYDPAYVRATFGLERHDNYDADLLAVAALAEHRAAAKKSGDVLTGCRVEWLEWSGSLKRPTATKMAIDGCTVAVKGQTATVTLPNGKTLIKRLATRGFTFASDDGQNS